MTVTTDIPQRNVGVPTSRRVSWVKMMRRLTHDGAYLMIDVIGATPAAQCRRADITTRARGEGAETVVT